MVTVIVNGAKQVQSLTIDPEVVSKDDVDMLQDLIVAAINDAQRKADEEMAQKYPLTPAPGERWVPIAWIVLSLIGMAVQLGLTGRKR